MYVCMYVCICVIALLGLAIVCHVTDVNIHNM